MSVKQIPLSFPIKESYDAQDFMRLPCNEAAMQWIDKFPDWHYPCVIVYGEEGCGKTHLLSLWQDRVGDDHRAIDDVDNIFGNAEAEKNLFHLFNQAKENKTYLMVSMQKPVVQYNIDLPDLASRLKAAPMVDISPPDDMDVQAILVKLFHDRQLQVEPGVIAYILPRIERSFTSIRDLVQKIDENSMAEKRSVTVPLVRAILSEPILL